MTIPYYMEIYFLDMHVFVSFATGMIRVPSGDSVATYLFFVYIIVMLINQALIFQFPIYLEPGVDRYLIYWQLGTWFQYVPNIVGNWKMRVNEGIYFLDIRIYDLMHKIRQFYMNRSAKEFMVYFQMVQIWCRSAGLILSINCSLAGGLNPFETY